MKKTFIKIFWLLVVSIAIEAICVYIQSNFFSKFLREKAVEILITLLAINTATSSFIVGKLHEISKERGENFAPIYIEIKRSLFYQIILIAVAFSVLTLEVSTAFKESVNLIKLGQFIDVILIFVFIAGIDILRDTGVAMFDILLHTKKEKKV